MLQRSTIVEGAQTYVQEFVELVRAEELLQAIAYARQHLAHWAEPYEAEHQRACALLAFRCEPAGGVRVCSCNWSSVRQEQSPA